MVIVLKKAYSEIYLTYIELKAAKNWNIVSTTGNRSIFTYSIIDT